MKILLVITKAEIGGAQAFVLNLARGLAKSGLQVAVAAGEGGFLSEELIKAKIDFFRLKSLKRSHNPFFVFRFIKELTKLIDKEEFDVLHLNSTNTLPGVLAARLAKRQPRTVFTVHGLSVLDPKYDAPRFLRSSFRAYFRFFFRYTDKIVFVSRYNLVEATKQEITDQGSVIYNGLEIAPDYFLPPVLARQELSRLVGQDLGQSFLIGSVGRLAVQKNYGWLIKMWPEIKKVRPEAKLIILGEGPEGKRYRRLIKKLGFINDIFLPGEIKDASRYLKGLNLFVLPSVYEGLSISLIEASAADISVCASDVGGNKEVIGAENCFALDNTAEFLAKIGQEPVVNISRSLFTAVSMVKKYHDIYEV